MAKYVMFVAGGARDPANPDASIFMGPGAIQPGAPPEFVIPYGLGAGAGTPYGLIYTRHMYRYGTKQEQMAQNIAALRAVEENARQKASSTLAPADQAASLPQPKPPQAKIDSRLPSPAGPQFSR